MNKGLFFLKCVLLGILAVIVFGWATQLLWNWLVPELFKGPVINFWQALGLLVLSKILFSGLGGGGKKSHGMQGAGPYWKHRFYEKFSNMPASQREEFKQRMKEKWCGFEKRTSDEKSDTSNG